LLKISVSVILRNMAKGKAKMLTIREVSEITGASASSIRVWLSDEEKRAQRFPNARKEDSPIGSFWLIPESDLKGFEARKRGRPLKPDSGLRYKRRTKAQE
jgi:hypothetical protein